MGQGCFSAGESFVYALQQRGRIKAVGQKTKGGGNAGAKHTLSSAYRVFVPHTSAVYPITGKGYGGIGVTPDIPAKKGTELQLAHALALHDLLKPAGKQKKIELARLIDDIRSGEGE